MAAKAKPRKPIKKGAKKSNAKAKKTAPSIARTLHHRVTAGRSHRGQTLQGMHPTTKMTHAGATAHFEVSYLTSLRQKGSALATAILQNCERDYTTLQQAFGGLTPQPLAYDVQLPSDR